LKIVKRLGCTGKMKEQKCKKDKFNLMMTTTKLIIIIISKKIEEQHVLYIRHHQLQVRHNELHEHRVSVEI
jgi:hypothetical protein